MYMLRQFRTSVCLSVTRVLCIKTAERIIEILSRSDRLIILVFRHQGSLRKSEGVTPKGGAKYKGVAIFDQFPAFSWVLSLWLVVVSVCPRVCPRYE